MEDDQIFLDPSSHLGVFLRCCILSFNLLTFEVLTSQTIAYACSLEIGIYIIVLLYNANMWYIVLWFFYVVSMVDANYLVIMLFYLLQVECIFLQLS